MSKLPVVSGREIIAALQRNWRVRDRGRTKSAGISVNLVRLCVGAEHPDDVIADLDQVLAKARTKTPEAVGP